MDSQEKVVQNSRNNAARLPKLEKQKAKTSYISRSRHPEKHASSGNRPLADCFPKASLEARKHVKTL